MRWKSLLQRHFHHKGPEADGNVPDEFRRNLRRAELVWSHRPCTQEVRRDIVCATTTRISEVPVRTRGACIAASAATPMAQATEARSPWNQP